MSMLTEKIMDIIDGALHEDAVAKFAQVLADCESSNWTVAQQAHEQVHEMLRSMGSADYDNFLAEATEFGVVNDLRPNSWLPG
jgi:hypothetical protein